MWSSGLSQPLLKALSSQDRWKDHIAGAIPAAGVDPDGFLAAWPSYRDYLLHPEPDDPYWHSPIYDAIRNSFAGVHVPVMMIGRSYDFFLPGMLQTSAACRPMRKAFSFSAPANMAARPAISRSITRTGAISPTRSHGSITS